MATSITTGVADHSTDAGFRAWGSEFSSLLASVGLVKASDTGQINWTTVLKPTESNGVAGFEIWKFNDSLSATAPIFIKIEYGNVSSIARPGLYITVGSGSDGSGVITGVVISERISCSLPSSGGFASLAKPRFFCHTEGSLLAVFHENTVNFFSGVGFFITRSCDNTGSLTSEAAAIYPCNGSANTSAGSSIVRFSGTVLPLNAFPVIVPNGMSSSAAGVDKQVFPHFASVPRVTMLPSILTVFINDFVAREPIVIDIGYGPRTFIPIIYSLGPGVGSASMVNGITCLAFLWE